ncbi:putative two-component system response regulator [Granulicella aggregans]|uniref:Putative two-component system response regulator n=1 Tax=Granulicella aggregans TaxID=474949 RepID=A0A7W7ZHM8_9BACT|nr:HD domain-containing phosphohydrolase [Granulicella aggregans]MBB5059908.1 putative two-component system response regulator [Granulicella aggregans]
MPHRILLVEDDPVQRTLLKEILALERISVTCVGDGGGAAHELRSNIPDLVLLDVNIPDGNGFEICRSLKANPETQLIPVVLLTGFAESDDRVRGIEAGADDFLTKPIDPIELKARVRSLLKRKEYTDELDSAEHVLMALGATIEEKDPYTKGHCERISLLSVQLGKKLGLGREELRALKIAGTLHDIGKVIVPDSILLKPGPLDFHEWSIMRRHAEAGERICKPLRSIQLVLPIVRHHHEKQDGSGYPDGLAGAEIPLLASVMQLVDVYDALTTDRPYRAALSVSRALTQMNIEVENGWWNAELFRVFAALMLEEAYPTSRPAVPNRDDRMSA